MTYAEILLKVLSEVSPEPEETLREKIEFLRKLAPGSRLDKELPGPEADALLKKMLEEKEGIIAWLIRGDLNKPPFDA